MQLTVEGNSIVENPYDGMCEVNNRWAKAESIKVLEDLVAVAEKVKADAESARDATIRAQKVAETAIAVAEAEKEKNDNA